MSFPVIHGLKLADGASITNFVVESLASDPASGDLSVGRIWYNTTDQEWKYASTDVGGSLVVKVMSYKSVVDAIDARTTSLENTVIYADGSRAMSGALDMAGQLVSNVADPVSNSDAANKGYVDTAIGGLGSAFEYVGTIDPSDASQANLDNLAKKAAGDFYRVTNSGTVTWTGGSHAVNAGDSLVWNPSGGVDKLDNTNSEVSGTASEIVVTGSTDNGFVVSIDPAYTANLNSSNQAAVDAQNELDASQVSIGINDDGSYSPVATASYIATATSVKQATQQLDSQVKVNTDAIAAEVAARQTSDTTLTNNLATEVTDRTNADAAITANLNTEINDRTNADSALQTEVTRVENKGRTETDSVVSAVNGRMFNFESTGAATQHTVNHNLNTVKLLAAVYVYDPDALAWQRDIVSEVATDVNNYTVELSVARQVRVSLMSLESVAGSEYQTA
jgi:hypothetical protein